MDEPELNFLVSGRRTGKTTRVLEWFAQGEITSRYPGWSRVIVCSTSPMMKYLRSRVQVEIPFGPPAQAITCLESWRQDRAVDRDVEVAYDDLDTQLHKLLGPGIPKILTFSGNLVDDDREELQSINEDLFELAQESIKCCEEMLRTIGRPYPQSSFVEQVKSLRTELENYS